MEQAVGIDLVYIPRMKKLAKNEAALKKVFHTGELKPFTPEHHARVFAAKEAFFKAMDDDLNTPAALAVLDRLAVDLSRTVEAEAVKHADTLLSLCRVLGLFLCYQPQPVELPTQLRTRLDAREAARKRKDFQSADQIRREFQEAGFILEDTARGPVVWRKP